MGGLLVLFSATSVVWRPRPLGRRLPWDSVQVVRSPKLGISLRHHFGIILTTTVQRNLENTKRVRVGTASCCAMTIEKRKK